MPPHAGGEGMTGNRTSVPPYRPFWTSENTATPTTPIVVPGAPILRRMGSASRPSPLRGSTSGRVLTPTPYRRVPAPPPDTTPTRHTPSRSRRRDPPPDRYLGGER